MKMSRKSKAFDICIVIILTCLPASDAPQAQLVLKELSPPPTLEFANLDSQIRSELYKHLKNVLDAERIRAKKEGRYEDVLFNHLNVLINQLDPKEKDKNLQEIDVVRKNALSEDQELLISFAGGIAGAGVQFLTGIPAPFLGEGAKVLGFKLGEYLVLRGISSAKLEYAKIGRMEIIYVRSANRVFVNASLEEPACKDVFIIVPIELKPKKTPWGTYVCPATWAGLTCPPEAAVKEIVPKLEDVKMIQSPRKDRDCVTQSATQPTITSSLQITPKKDKYQVGDILTAEFTIANKGNAPITFNVLTVGGRVNDICPNDKCPDFTWKTNVTLRPDEVYHYKGKLKLESPGNYHFFTTYRTKDGQWNTSIPTISADVSNTKSILVESKPKKYPDTPDKVVEALFQALKSGNCSEAKKYFANEALREVENKFRKDGFHTFEEGCKNTLTKSISDCHSIKITEVEIKGTFAWVSFNEYRIDGKFLRHEKRVPLIKEEGLWKVTGDNRPGDGKPKSQPSRPAPKPPAKKY